MNANELAILLDKLNEEEYRSGVIEETITMLRQQQAEIEALKAEIVAIEKNIDYWADKANWIKNNEPVAYVSTTGLNDIEWTDASHSLNYGDALYLHPTKTLTDEEIEKVFYDTHFGFKGSDDSDFMDFARAILRKAQEK